ncbi:MAG: AMP-binding protein [Halobacteriales archaeon]|nr:AMP-binding protein [Halobacteriales archaeon]
MSELAWVPPPERVARANVTQFMKRHGIATLPELVARSQAEPEWFWRAVEQDLGFFWAEPYTHVLDTSRGKPWAQWFVGGKTNLTANCVDRWAKLKPDKVALAWEGEDGDTRRWTYADLQRNVNQLAGALRQRGIGPGDAVGVHLPMLPETACALLAIAKLGALFVPLFSGFGAEAIAKRLGDCDAKLLLTCDGTLRRGQPVAMKPVADEALRGVPTCTRVLVLRRTGAPVAMQAGRDEDWEQAVKDQPVRMLTEPFDSEHPWMVIYTSGTTGRPKGSVHVHAGFLVKIAQEVWHQTDVHDDDVLCWLTDMGWIMGPWLVVGGLALGGTILLYEGSPDWPDPGRLWQVVAKHNVSILGVSPTLIRSLMKHGDAWPAKHDLSSLRSFGSTGEPWNPEPWRWLFETVGQRKAPIINLSGGTEVGACFLSPTPASALKPCSLGHPALGMAVDIVDEEGQPVPQGQVGELVCREPWPGMTRGLWKDPERYLATYWSRFPGLWYHGDFASVDADGQWFLHGRSDDTIKIAGKRVGPAEVESILVDTGLVAECAAVGIPDATKGEVVHCWAILRPHAEASEQLAARLADAVEKSLGKPFRPKGVHFVKDLPRTRNAKILRRAVRAAAQGKEAGDLSSLANPEALREVRRVT